MAPSSNYYLNLEEQYGAHNYHPVPVVLSKASGVHVWDVEGKKYIDCLSAYSACNQGFDNGALMNRTLPSQNSQCRHSATTKTSHLFTGVP